MVQVKQSVIPNGCHCIKSKWVFKIKRDGMFRARLIVCGYSRIPGVDFAENYAPVMNDVTWRILLVAMIVWKLDAIIVDVETAFLHSDLCQDLMVQSPSMNSQGDNNHHQHHHHNQRKMRNCQGKELRIVLMMFTWRSNELRERKRIKNCQNDIYEENK